MTQITTGIRRVLSHPAVYTAFQRIMGANEGWRQFVLRDIRPMAGMRLLDIGCGPADLLDHLPAVEYWGFDPSTTYIEHARGKHGARGHFFADLLTEATLEHLPSFDLVVMSGVLHHLADAEARAVLALANRALVDSGRLVTVDPCLVPGQNPVARWLIKADRGRNVRDEAGYRALVETILPVCRSTVRHKRWIPYTHCFMECARR